jgi:hypothetical protein
MSSWTRSNLHYPFALTSNKAIDFLPFGHGPQQLLQLPHTIHRQTLNTAYELLMPDTRGHLLQTPPQEEEHGGHHHHPPLLCIHLYNVGFGFEIKMKFEKHGSDGTIGLD